jgi:hypothetical protein
MNRDATNTDKFLSNKASYEELVSEINSYELQKGLIEQYDQQTRTLETRLKETRALKLQAETAADVHKKRIQQLQSTLREPTTQTHQIIPSNKHDVHSTRPAQDTSHSQTSYPAYSDRRQSREINTKFQRPPQIHRRIYESYRNPSPIRLNTRRYIVNQQDSNQPSTSRQIHRERNNTRSSPNSKSHHPYRQTPSKDRPTEKSDSSHTTNPWSRTQQYPTPKQTQSVARPRVKPPTQDDPKKDELAPRPPSEASTTDSLGFDFDQQ